MTPETLQAPSQAQRINRMRGMVDDLWFLKRDLVSDGFDAALARLKKELPLTTHSFESGSEVWSWIVPEKWTCHEAYIERLNGQRILDVRNHPLHCASYSSSFEGVVKKEELLTHLSVSSRQPEAIPYAWTHYKKDWGLCASVGFKESLTDAAYRVVIRTTHEPGFLKVGEVKVPGSSEDEFVLCAHLDHPAMANDDLSGVVVGVEVMRALLQQTDLRYTYRLLLTPETIGSVAWLSRHEERIPHIQGGLFLEMLGTDCPHALQHSFYGTTPADRLLGMALSELDPQCWSGAYRRVIGNDERQFNAPGVRIPMLSLSRVFPPETGKWPYPEYHTSADSAHFISLARMDQSVDLVLQMLRWWEENQYPVNLFRGELFLSRYGLFVDFYKDREGNLKLFDVIQQIDGTKSLAEIAHHCGVPFSFVLKIIQTLERQGLVRRAQQRALDGDRS